MQRKKYKIAFESAKLSYSSHDVDLYNTGVNQILSIAASRGHEIYHFSLDDLVIHSGRPHAIMSVLTLDGIHGNDVLDAYRKLRKTDEKVVPLEEIDMYMLRADDVKPGMPNLDILKSAEQDSIFLETIEDTLSTTDKYEVINRCPHVQSPATYKADSLQEAKAGISAIPLKNGKFIVKDRFGYGCGAQVHMLSTNDSSVESKIESYIDKYQNIIIQEFCPEVYDGDIVVTFFDGEMLGAMKRLPGEGEWKTNASLGAKEVRYDISDRQEAIARAVADKFSGCRFTSIDMFEDGRVIEINAFPGGKGLNNLYGISVGTIVMDKLEKEAEQIHGSRYRKAS